MSGNIINIEDIDLLAKVGIKYYDRKQYPDAFRLFSRIIEIDQKHFEAHFYLSAIYEIVGEYDKAIKEFEILINLKEDDNDLKEFLLSLYVKRNKYKKALALLKVLLKHSPFSFNYWENLIDVLIKSNKYNIFKANTNLMNEYFPMVNDVLLRVMLIYRDSDQLNYALLIADLLIDLDYNNPVNHYFIGTIYEAMNDTYNLKREFSLTYRLLKRYDIENNILYQEISNRLVELGFYN
jgi:tetratricopeptide (TPR) repeat protein